MRMTVPLMRITVPLMGMTVPLMRIIVPLMGITVPLMGITVPLIPTACCTASVLGTVAPLAQAVADLHLRMLKRADYDVFDTTMKVPLATRPIPVQTPHGVGRSVLQCVRACARDKRSILWCAGPILSPTAVAAAQGLHSWLILSAVPMQMRHG